MFNCAAVKRWKRSVAWFPSYTANSVADAERNLSKKRNVLRCYGKVLMSPYTIVLRKFTRVLVKKAAWKSAKTVGKGCC